MGYGGNNMIAVRYLSHSGNTKRIAEAIAEGASTTALSIIDEPFMKEHVDTLFLGGAPYANIMDPKLREYAENINAKMVSKVVLFTTSNWSHRTVKALRKMFEQKGISVESEHFYAHMLRINARLDAAKEFGKKYARS